ncbi:hypothetical protein TRFO_21968 [Tritrichomonas foetus]|uniref:Uncharacterized protein n=1 Tax=Tritrichomonas foetus TaxID=1144522 RepID=A0A1J4KDF7_9EUKA|nr:hypothetical protein TRFO_21968 [Tritrichomonas foetus]|eukprot:OHT09227.1 hypothetical protein TRFO_21968 [Tritrichomonas foetus]
MRENDKTFQKKTPHPIKKSDFFHKSGVFEIITMIPGQRNWSLPERFRCGLFPSSNVLPLQCESSCRISVKVHCQYYNGDLEVDITDSPDTIYSIIAASSPLMNQNEMTHKNDNQVSSLYTNYSNSDRSSGIVKSGISIINYSTTINPDNSNMSYNNNVFQNHHYPLKKDISKMKFVANGRILSPALSLGFQGIRNGDVLYIIPSDLDKESNDSLSTLLEVKKRERHIQRLRDRFNAQWASKFRDPDAVFEQIKGASDPTTAHESARLADVYRIRVEENSSAYRKVCRRFLKMKDANKVSQSSLMCDTFSSSLPNNMYTNFLNNNINNKSNIGFTNINRNCFNQLNDENLPTVIPSRLSRPSSTPLPNVFMGVSLTSSEQNNYLLL